MQKDDNTLAQELLIEALRPLLKDSSGSRTYGLVGPCKVTVLHTNNQYRKEALTGDEEFWLKGMRVGKKGLIFEFDPVDARAWTQMEMSEDAIDYVKDLPADLSRLLSRPVRQKGDLAKVGDELLRLVRQAEEEKIARAQAEKDALYDGHQLYGAF